MLAETRRIVCGIVGCLVVCGLLINTVAAEVQMQTYTYKQVGDLEIKADVYRVDDKKGRPVIVWIHGGALIMGGREDVDGRVKKMFLDAGYTIVSIDYRLAPETKLPAIIEDVEDAFKWLREKGPELLHIDSSRIAVLGGSAGGYLTLATGYRVQPRPTVLVAFWGYGDLIGDWYSKPSPHPRHQRSKMAEDEVRRQVSGPVIANSKDRKGDGGAFYQFCRQRGIWPEEVSGWDPHEEAKRFEPYMPLNNVTSEYPPTLLIHGMKDTDVPCEQSIMMADQFKKHHIDHELIMVEGAEHGLAGADPDKIDQAYERAFQFVHQRMTGFDAKRSSNVSSRDDVDGTKSALVEIQPLVQAPSNPAQWGLWRTELAAARRHAREQTAYDDTFYRRPEFRWASSCYSCCFLMMYDEAFYDRNRNQYTIDSLIDDGIARFGGYDAIVLWHAYPRIGFDDRNQFDFYRDMPGGLDGLRLLSRSIHSRSIKVFIDYNPWDTGTRREDESDADTLVELASTIEADGIFLDTLHEGMKDLRVKLDAARPGVVLESELTLPIGRIHDHHMSWAQGFTDSEVPGVLWNKWFERRHMMHQIKRWNLDHSEELQMAWMNGSGILVWENVFGSWVPWSARDRSILRAMLPIQRRFADLFCGEQWTPLIGTEKAGVYASLWEGRGLRLWTLVNRSEVLVEGALLRVPHTEGVRYFDLITGRETGRISDGVTSINGAIRARGIGAFISGRDDALGSDFPAFLTKQADTESRTSSGVGILPASREGILPPLPAAGKMPAGPKAGTASPRTAFIARDERLREVVPTERYQIEHIPAGMVVVPKASFDMEVRYRNRECGFYQVPQLGESAHPRRGLNQAVSFTRKVQLRPYAIDLTLVTNAEFAAFLKATGYWPTQAENFLKHWKNGAPPPGLEDHPVVYVDLEDARAYAKWAGKRLPTEEEWQYAAQGADKRTYPWGNSFQEDFCNGGRTGGTTSVAAFPEGRSPFGCYDMCGNVWQWTQSERSDGRTRFCIVRGGSFFKAQGSSWYADGGPQPCNFAAKFILMWPGLDRCATIGFRCAVDVAEE